MGAGRKSRHSVMLVEKQEWFARLITQGVNNAEACRIVGINGSSQLAVALVPAGCDLP